MIDLYFWPTPNGLKIKLFLEETALPYRTVAVDIGKGEQFQPSFLTISPNNRIPALIDHEPAGGGGALSVFESGAMLLYLAEKTGRFLPNELRARVEVLQWLFWQVAGLGPMSDDDGKTLSVHVHSVGHELDVEATDAHYSLPGCAMTFAYWNPVMLLQNHLINPETGEDVPVDIRLNGEEDIQVHNESVHAKRYYLHSAKMDIDLWYSAQGDWLALETPEKGRRLRYVLN